MIDKVLATLIACLCLVVLVLPVCADEGTPESEEGRYTFSKIADGFIRLDMLSIEGVDLQPADRRLGLSGSARGPRSARE